MLWDLSPHKEDDPESQTTRTAVGKRPAPACNEADFKPWGENLEAVIIMRVAPARTVGPE